ncbi:MAG TPA: gamma-glutamyl-gamma-aminobutyrate hydrolase family protein [Xanthomonadales bacterium]|nr:gamma-glutamyl-gamma-aminobutyrate hydrolase family protein [Xanthomonadales bacterium]
MALRPLVGIVADRRMQGEHPFHMVGEKYFQALVHGAGAYAVALPSIQDDILASSVLDKLDGLFLPGSPSDVQPHHYGKELEDPASWHDAHRDATSFHLIPAVIEAGIPLLAVCRGFQEFNVSFGGSLHQKLRDIPGMLNHREDPDAALDEQYAPSHPVAFTNGGLLHHITNRTTAEVNSLHRQGIDQLAEGLEVEALAEDGLIEAVTVPDAPGFNLAVQWHPEWKATENPLSMSIFGAFGNALRQYQDSR